MVYIIRKYLTIIKKSMIKIGPWNLSLAELNFAMWLASGRTRVQGPIICTYYYNVLIFVYSYISSIDYIVRILLFYIERTCVKRTCSKWTQLVCTDRITTITWMLSNIPRFYLQHDVSRVDPWCEPLGSTLSITECQRLILINESPRYHGSKTVYQSQCAWAPWED